MFGWFQSYSSQAGNQHVLDGARNTKIGKAVFNNVGRDQINQNLYTGNPLWEAIADVGASHNSEQQVDRGHCLPGTRKAVLELFRQWRVSGYQSLPICWLSGAAGVGKSAIALSVAEECEEDHGLVASFFFFRSDPKRNNASSLILSIAHGLAVTRPHLKPVVDERIATDPRILKAKLEDQYKKLILQNLDHSPPSSVQNAPDLVIIDGLDECGDASAQRRVLSIIFSTYQQPFHYPLRFLICSRPESWIRQEFSRFSELTKHIKLDDTFRPQYDIELYLHRHFEEIRRDPNYSEVEFPDPWPSRHHFLLLVTKADGQFIYPSTVIKFIKTEYTLPTDQLRILLDTVSNPSSVSLTHSPFHDLDELYLMILRANPDRDKRLLPILAMIVVVDGWRQRSPEFIELVLGLSHGTVSQTLRAMHSVLDVRGRDDDIRAYHKSFTDFLLDQARSNEFFINKSEWEDFLACRWTRVLTEQCRKDPELLRHKDLSVSLGMLVYRWNEFLAKVDGRMAMSSALTSEVDAFYHVALSISAQCMGHDMLRHILAAILLLPSGDPRAPRFIRLLLGLGAFRSQDLIIFCPTDALDQALQTMQTVLQVGKLDISLHDNHSTFRDFLFDRKRSHSFFIEKGYQSSFLAQSCLRLLQMDEGPQDEILLPNWARICAGVDNPTKELFFDLYHMDLGVVLTKSLGRFYLPRLFRDFETISTWLESRTNGVAPPDLIRRFRNVQRGFHIRSMRQVPGFRHDVVAMIVLSIVGRMVGRYQSLRRVSMIVTDEVFPCMSSQGFSEMFNNELRLAEFCGCSDSAFDSNSTPIPGADLYHVNIPAGCAQVFRIYVASFGPLGTPFDNIFVDHRLMECANLLPRCLPLPELLPHFRTLLDFAKSLRRGYLGWVSKESRVRLLSWLEKFPVDCASEVETIRNDLLSLMGVNE